LGKLMTHKTPSHRESEAHFDQFLASSVVIDWSDPDVEECASLLKCERGSRAELLTVNSCFEFVRDHIRHSSDQRCGPVTCRASDVLRHATGYCYAKSHLLAALLRANGIPAGFCYQRLAVGEKGPPFCLHGFNAVFLRSFGWYRIDARGNKPGVRAEFIPPMERLAFSPLSPEEVEFDEILPEPLAVVVAALRKHEQWDALLADLPDIAPERWGEHGLTVRRQE
jgi:transglutaminase-like putative cysteine protease